MQAKERSDRVRSSGKEKEKQYLSDLRVLTSQKHEKLQTKRACAEQQVVAQLWPVLSPTRDDCGHGQLILPIALTNARKSAARVTSAHAGSGAPALLRDGRDLRLLQTHSRRRGPKSYQALGVGDGAHFGLDGTMGTNNTNAKRVTNTCLGAHTLFIHVCMETIFTHTLYIQIQFFRHLSRILLADK